MFPPFFRAATGVNVMSTITSRIAEFTAALTYADLPVAVREKVKVSLLHNLGMAVSAGTLVDVSNRYAAELNESGSSASSRLLLSGKVASPETAAFLNGILIHARCQDDVYFPGLMHIGTIVTPAVLAIGEKINCTGEELITALAAGYEAAGALSDGYAVRTTARGFRASGIFGVFGATAAVAKLLGLNAAQTANALGIAASMAAGTNQTWLSGTQEWQFQIGLAARNGILAANLAAAGGTGSPEALEGKGGFYAAFMGSTQGVEKIGYDLGSLWRSLSITYKPYPVCGILQGPVVEAIEMAKEYEIDPEQISAVRISLPVAEAAYPGTDYTGPFYDVGNALMSSQYCLAVALLKRSFQSEDLLSREDAALLKLVQQIKVIPDESLKPRSFILEIDAKDGKTLTKVSSSSEDDFDWDRNEEVAHLESMATEMPFSADRLNNLISMTLTAEEHTAKELVTATIV